MKLITKLFQLVILPLVIAGAFFTWSLPRVTSDYNFNADELIYLDRSSYWEAFKSGDFNNPMWKEWGSFDQPQLTNYIYAAVPGDRYILDDSNSPCQNESDSSFFNAWSCLDGPPINTWPESLDPVQNMLTQARVLATGISAIVVATTYYLGLIVAGPLGGIIAALYLGWFSFFKNLSTMVMMDQILMVFLNLQLILSIYLAHREKSRLALTLVLGVLTGLAVSTKLSAIIPSLIIYGSLGVITLFKKQLSLGHLLVSALLAGAIFTSLHPQIWPNPVAGVYKMLTWRTDQIAAQQSPIYVPTNMVDKTVYSLKETFSSWKSGDELTTTVGLSAIALISLLSLFKTRPAFAAISGLNMLAFVLILPLKWNRYLLPVMPAAAVYLANVPNILALIYQFLKSNLVQIKQFLTGGIVALLLVSLFLLIPQASWLSTIVLITTLLLTIQGYLVTRAMLYGFSHKESKPLTEQSPINTFSLVVPARDEAGVIGHTITSLANLNYPKDLYEVMVVIRADDYDTIMAAEAAIKNASANHIRIVQIDGEAHNKAYSLNIGLHLAKFDIVGIFDAEDEPHRDILQKINDHLIANPDNGAVQAPVHLTNINSTWYSSLNAIEYYYWFKSVLPYLATKRIIPLGGNTIFTKKDVFDIIGGYDESCLTEDADLGIRLAEGKIKIGVIDEANLATKEETPISEAELIKQRSRWDQGYLQVLNKANWLNLSFTQKVYAFYTLTQPLFRHLSFLNMIFAPLLASFGHIPLGLVILSFLPGYFLIMQLGLYLLGLAELAKIHSLKISFWRYITTILAFIPYQALLTLATFRALGKISLGNYSWDKTGHTNSHRPDLAILER